MVVYLDVLFGTNALMDYITLLAAAHLGGVRVKRLRLLLAAGLGGCYAAAAAVQPWLAVLPVRLLAGLSVCAAAFWRQNAFARVCALYLIVAAAFAGLAAVLGRAAERQLLYGAGYYFAVPMRVLLLAAAAGYAVSGVLLRGDAQHGPLRREVEQLTVRFGSTERTVRVLHDTGNDLAEPVSGRTVVVLERAAAASLISVSTALFFPVALLVALWPLGLTGVWLNFAGTALLAGLLALFLLLRFVRRGGMDLPAT